MSFSQDLIFTVLPTGQTSTTANGTTQHYLDFSVIISPRLKSTSTAHTTLINYPDWCSADPANPNWADTVAGLIPHLQLSVTNSANAHVGDFALTRLTALPTRAHFGTVFGSGTPVFPYLYKGLEGRKVRSAPAATIADTIARLYGNFGLTSPTAFPTWEHLVPAAAFGALGFEQQVPATRELQDLPDPGIHGDGQVRKATLKNALEDAISAAKAPPTDLNQFVTAKHLTGIPGAATSLAFLQHQQLVQRDRPATNAFTDPAPAPAWDFHNMVSGLASTPTLLRTFGFVISFKAAVPDSLATPASTPAGPYQVVLKFATPFAFQLATTPVLPATSAYINKGVFRPAPRSTSLTDHVNRMLKLGDPALYRVIQVDHDNAAIKAMQFAGNVTRSHHGGAKQTLTTPDRFALPALKTGGFAIARSGRAAKMHASLDHQTTKLQNTYFGTGTKPPLTEDDLTRGYRFDVLNESHDTKWRSLMWRQGPVLIGTDKIPLVTEEDTVVPAPTTASRNPNDPQDLYLQETLTRWDGWSLAVPRVGLPAQGLGGRAPNNTGDSLGFSVTTSWHVPGSYRTETLEVDDANHVNDLRLPRLRFGDTYRLRARAVDLAGNSLSVAGAPKTGAAISPPLKHLRFEPIPAPRMMLVDTPLSGASEEVVVIRSESATVNGAGAMDNGVTTRLVLPAPTSVFMAEQHGAFDATSANEPMENTTAVYADLAKRDGYRMALDPLVQLPHGGAHSNANPYVVPGGFLPISYLPEFIGREALVRDLPTNTHKQNTAVLPFHAGSAKWPQAFEACRVVLRRGATTDWSVNPAVTDPNSAQKVAELDLALTKGVMVTTLVNCGITADQANLMAVWEWIKTEAAAQHKSTTDVWNDIVRGEHWMFTPWRRVTFIHAVRTPLLVPILFLQPTKTTIGQTYATFTGTKTKPQGGTVRMSRKSTARVDVDATWTMPIDNGVDGDPTALKAFAAHAFEIEVDRAGIGYLPSGKEILQTTDAINFSRKHEFGDTKFRAVNYKATATSFYVEYFREEIPGHFLPLGTDPVATLRANPIKPGVAFEGSTVKLTMSWTTTGTSGPVLHTRELIAAPPGTPHNAPSPTPGDYVVVEDPNLAGNPAGATNGTIQVLANADLSSTVPGTSNYLIRMSYVGPTIHTYSTPTADKTTSASMLVLNAARPKAPDVRYVVPIYRRSASTTAITRYGGGLRVYLERPWWSTGDKEELGVLCWHKGTSTSHLPADALAPYVTAWGYDPVYKSTTAIDDHPIPKCFPLAVSTSSSGSLTLDETTYKVDVAGHRVGWDSGRKLWYCDIQVTDSAGHELKTYSPFIRFAFARYQPHSIANAHLSKVVTVDFAQLAPNRSVTLGSTDSAGRRQVTVVGRAPTATRASTKPSHMYAIIEQKDSRISDDALAWSRATNGPDLPFFNPVFELTPSTTDADHVTWTGHISLPEGNLLDQRVTFEEHERISGGTGNGRLVWTDSLPLVSLPH